MSQLQDFAVPDNHSFAEAAKTGNAFDGISLRHGEMSLDLFALVPLGFAQDGFILQVGSRCYPSQPMRCQVSVDDLLALESIFGNAAYTLELVNRGRIEVQDSEPENVVLSSGPEQLTSIDEADLAGDAINYAGVR